MMQPLEQEVVQVKKKGQAKAQTGFEQPGLQKGNSIVTISINSVNMGPDSQYLKEHQVVSSIDLAETEKRYDLVAPKETSGCVVFIERRGAKVIPSSPEKQSKA